MRRRLFLLLVCAPLCVIAGSSSEAAISPCGTKGNYFDGAQLTGVNHYGVEAFIDTFNPALCGSVSDSSAWVMEGKPGDAKGYAQAGYAKTGSGNLEIFAQWREGSGFPGPHEVDFAFPPPPDDVLHFKVGYNSNTGRLQMWEGPLDQQFGDTQLAVTDFDPMASWSWPWNGRFEGETLHCESDVPGVLSFPVRFTVIKKKQSDGTWSDINNLALPASSCGSATTRYYRQWITQPGSFKIWTDPLH